MSGKVRLMSRENGIEEPAGINSHDASGPGHVDSESKEIRLIKGSDYVKALDEVDPGFAERILSLIAEEHRYEYSRAKWEFRLRIARVVTTIVVFALLLGIVIYLSVRGEQGAAQAIFLALNVTAVLVTLWARWAERTDGDRAHKRVAGDINRPKGRSE
jgi:hypothetical protein